MRVVFISAECEPWAKTGGLGDVVDALARAVGAMRPAGDPVEGSCRSRRCSAPGPSYRRQGEVELPGYVSRPCDVFLPVPGRCPDRATTR
jgi:hypothetical protein